MRYQRQAKMLNNRKTPLIAPNMIKCAFYQFIHLIASKCQNKHKNAAKCDDIVDYCYQAASNNVIRYATL